MPRDKFYITTAIDYSNAPPHIGHALEKVQADVLARFYRTKGKNVFFLTGTDEHGVKNVRAAESAGKDLQEFTGEIAEKFKALKGELNLSWDDFIRTTDQARHWPGVRLMWEKLHAAGDIYKKKYKGLYCVGHEAFVTRKDLVPTPFPTGRNSDRSVGVDDICADHGTSPEVVEEENYFFRLSKYSEEIGKKIRSGELKVVPEGRQNEILSLVEKEGLKDVSFSRPRKDLDWGIPVPGDDTQTIYVWCDALTNYLSAIGYGRDDSWQKLWPPDIQLIGKDILRFHAAIWPGMLLSAGLQLPKKIFVHGFVTVDGQKMSKTIGNIVDPVELVEEYGTDAVRYYLLREIPSGEDGDFSEEKFRERYNGDLANGLGNFAARVLTLGAGLGEVGSDLSPNKEVVQRIETAKSGVSEKLEAFKLHEALAEIWRLIGFGDAYANKTTPWGISDPKEKARVVFDLVVVLDNVAALLAPFLPETAEKITKNVNWQDSVLKVEKGEVLFPRLG